MEPARVGSDGDMTGIGREIKGCWRNYVRLSPVRLKKMSGADESIF